MANDGICLAQNKVKGKDLRRKWESYQRTNDILNRSITSGPGMEFGMRLMQNMGWSEGQGLGSDLQGMIEPIRLKQTINSKGLGYTSRGTEQEDYSAHFSRFEGVLQALVAQKPEQEPADKTVVKTKKDKQSDGTTQKKGQNSTSGGVVGSFISSDSDSSASDHNDAASSLKKKKTAGLDKGLEAKSLAVRGRNHRQKYARMKDTSRYSADDMACILGSKAHSLYTAAQVQSKQDNFVNASYDSSEYFATAKRQMLNQLKEDGTYPADSSKQSFAPALTPDQSEDEQDELSRPSFGGLGFSEPKHTHDRDFVAQNNEPDRFVPTNDYLKGLTNKFANEYQSRFVKSDTGLPGSLGKSSDGGDSLTNDVELEANMDKENNSKDKDSEENCTEVTSNHSKKKAKKSKKSKTKKSKTKMGESPETEIQLVSNNNDHAEYNLEREQSINNTVFDHMKSKFAQNYMNAFVKADTSIGSTFEDGNRNNKNTIVEGNDINVDKTENCDNIQEIVLLDKSAKKKKSKKDKSSINTKSDANFEDIDIPQCDEISTQQKTKKSKKDKKNKRKIDVISVEERTADCHDGASKSNLPKLDLDTTEKEIIVTDNITEENKSKKKHKKNKKRQREETERSATLIDDSIVEILDEVNGIIVEEEIIMVKGKKAPIQDNNSPQVDHGRKKKEKRQKKQRAESAADQSSNDTIDICDESVIVLQEEQQVEEQEPLKKKRKKHQSCQDSMIHNGEKLEDQDKCGAEMEVDLAVNNVSNKKSKKKSRKAKKSESVN